MPIADHDDLMKQVPTIVDLIRSQNWKNGGCLTVDRPEAITVIENLVSAAYSAGSLDGTRAAGERMLATFDAAINAQKPSGAS